MKRKFKVGDFVERIGESVHHAYVGKVYIVYHIDKDEFNITDLNGLVHEGSMKQPYNYKRDYFKKVSKLEFQIQKELGL